MKIKNETDYDGRFLKTVITAVHRHVARAEGRQVPGWKTLTVRVQYGGRITSCGSRTIWVPKTGQFTTAERLAEYAWHQIYHWLGYEHGRRHTRFGGRRMIRNWPSSSAIVAMLQPVKIKPSDPLPKRLSLQKPKSDVRQAVLRVRAEKDKAEADLRRALEKRKEFTVKAKHVKNGLARWRSKELAARRRLEKYHGDPDAVAREVLGNYEPAMAGDIKV